MIRLSKGIDDHRPDPNNPGRIDTTKTSSGCSPYPEACGRQGPYRARYGLTTPIMRVPGSELGSSRMPE